MPFGLTPTFVDQRAPEGGGPVVTGDGEISGFDSRLRLTAEGIARVTTESVLRLVPGAEGERGADGEPGMPGAKGADGQPGAQGPAGQPGFPGTDGVDGNDGFPGRQGDPGPVGAQGPAFVFFGADGDPGPEGIQGMPGPAGIDGQQGPAGAPFVYFGADGNDGPEGMQGFPGQTGATGPQGPAGAQVVVFGIDGVDGIDAPFSLAPGWANALSANPRSGANDVFVDVSRFMNFGLDGPTASNPQIRSGDSVFRIRGSQTVTLGGDLAAIVFATNGSTTIASDATGSVILQTALTNRLVISQSGEWTTPSGSFGQVFTHQGPGNPPIWVSPASTSVSPAIGFLSNTDERDGEERGAFIPKPQTASSASGALTGEVTQAVAGGPTTVVRSTDFSVSVPWTGEHEFRGKVDFVSFTHLRNRLSPAPIVADIVDAAVNTVNVLRISSGAGAPFNLTSMVPSGDGQLVYIQNADTGDALLIPNESLSTATAGNRFTTPNADTFVLPPGSSVWARYDGVASRWYLTTNPSLGRFLRRTVLTTGTAATFTHLSECRFFITEGVGGGAAGGGVANVAGDAGACGGSGTWARNKWTKTAATSTYTVGTGGAGVSGGTGSSGTGSSWTHNAVALGLPPGTGGPRLAGGASVGRIAGGAGGGNPTGFAPDVQVNGQKGGDAVRPTASTAFMQHTSHGGSTPLGNGGSANSATTAQVAGSAGTGYGAGGSGALEGSTTSASIAGGAGSPGIWIVDEYS